MRKLFYKAKTDDYREASTPEEYEQATADGYTVEVTDSPEHEERFQRQEQVRE